MGNQFNVPPKVSGVERTDGSKLEVPNFEKQLDVPNFEKVKNLQTYKSAIRETHGKIRWKRVAAAVLVVFLTLGGFANAAWHNANYETVEHSGDTASDGMLRHNHELDKKTYVRDYKFVNEEATYQDVIDAIDNGEFKYYRDHNGEVRKRQELQGPKGKDDISFYNENAVEFEEMFRDITSIPEESQIKK